MYCFTSITNNYIPKARVLANSLKTFHPDWKFALVICEPLHDSVELQNEPFDQIITLSELGIPNLESWIFKHNVMEICTAAKGPAAAYIAATTETDKLMYLDPDIVVFDSLDDISAQLDISPIILTPHQTKPEITSIDIFRNEMCFLKHGSYNLGFFAVRCEGQGQDFINWYRDRLLEFCYIDFNQGLYTDQRWCDLAPILFDQLYINRDPTCNLARWNVSQRSLSKRESQKYFIEESPLKFFHFSSYDSGQGKKEIARYARKDHCLFELWDWYGEQLKINGEADFSKMEWKYDRFNSGARITQEMRLLYRVRADLQKAFPFPFSDNNPYGFFEDWYSKNSDITPSRRENVHRFVDKLIDKINSVCPWQVRQHFL